MTDHRSLVSVIAPVFNEDKLIAELHSRISKAVDGVRTHRFEMIYVDDGSRDGTLDALKGLQKSDPRIRIVELRRNFGQTPALSAGLDHSRGEIVITMDADLQHFPEDIPEFLREIDGGFDLVCGWRKERREGAIRRWPSTAANRMIRWISGLDIHDFGTTFRAYRREILADLPLFGELHRFVPALAHQAGCRIKEIPIQNIARPAGKSNYGISRTFGVFLDLIFLYYYIRYLTRPMRVFGQLAALFFVPGFFIAGMLVALTYAHVIRSAIEHQALLMLSTLLMIIGVQLLTAGLLAEMINRIYVATNRRGIYRVRQLWEAQPS